MTGYIFSVDQNEPYSVAMAQIYNALIGLLLIKLISKTQELHHLNIHPSKNYHIKKRKKWLELELSGSVLLFLTYAFGMTIILAILAAVLFLPLLFKVLIKERRYG